MKRLQHIMVMFASLLAGGTLFSSCQQYRDLIWPSVRDGLYTYISGSVTNSVNATMLSDFIIDSFLGGVSGDGGTGE